MTADDAVRRQYEELPYPARDPADEARRLVTGSPSHILEVEHYVLAGHRAGPLRCLVAGGGTGDAAIMLAQQLADRGEGGHVDYLDPSAAARAIAEARARVRGLANIAFHTGSLLDLARLGLGGYDYVDCCGVLHHLDDPVAGLASLERALGPGGGMGLMLYGEPGRSGVYPLQRALRRLAGDDGTAERLALARRLIDSLPPENLFRRNPRLADHRTGGDAALFDLLLHARDRAWTVPQIVELTDAAGLAITGFVPPLAYRPDLLLADPVLRRRAVALPPLAAAALAEELANSQKTHRFYAVRAADLAAGRAGAAVPDRADLVPVLRHDQPERLRASLAGTETLKADLEGVTVRLPLPAASRGLLAAVDGRTSLAGLHAASRRRQPDLSWPAFLGRFGRLWQPLATFNLMLLAGPAAPPRSRG